MSDAVNDAVNDEEQKEWDYILHLQGKCNPEECIFCNKEIELLRHGKGGTN